MRRSFPRRLSETRLSLIDPNPSRMAQPPRDASTGEAPSGVRQVCDATGGKTERVGLFAQPENAFDAVLYALAASVVKSGQASRFLSTPSGMAAGEGRDRGPPVLMPAAGPMQATCADLAGS